MVSRCKHQKQVAIILLTVILSVNFASAQDSTSRRSFGGRSSGFNQNKQDLMSFIKEYNLWIQREISYASIESVIWDKLVAENRGYKSDEFYRNVGIRSKAQAVSTVGFNKNYIGYQQWTCLLEIKKILIKEPKLREACLQKIKTHPNVDAESELDRSIDNIKELIELSRKAM